MLSTWSPWLPFPPFFLALFPLVVRHSSFSPALTTTCCQKKKCSLKVTCRFRTQTVRCPYVIIGAQQITVLRHLINGFSRRETRREIAFIYTKQLGSGDQTKLYSLGHKHGHSRQTWPDIMLNYCLGCSSV